MDGIKDFVKKNGIRVALLCVPAETAQAVADILSDAGIKGILNFSPAVLILPDDVYVGSVDMASEIGNIIYQMDKKQTQE